MKLTSYGKLKPECISQGIYAYLCGLVCSPRLTLSLVFQHCPDIPQRNGFHPSTYSPL